MKFRYYQTIFVIFLATLLAIGNVSSVFSPESEIGLLSYMARSNDLLQQDPARSLDCFNKYIPLINQIAKDYETNFQTCLNESAAASSKADESTLEQRNELANAVEASCDLLKQCQNDSTVEGIFQCYIDGGSANIRTMYTINANASQELAALREQYYLIRNDEYKCTNETKRTYEKESSEAYAGLNNCILGYSDITTEQPSTTAKTTTDVPTEATEKTTPAEPETTDNPITSTIKPETTEIAPEETTSENPKESSSSPETSTEEPTTAKTDTTSIEPETSDSPTTAPVIPETTAVTEESTSRNPEE